MKVILSLQPKDFMNMVDDGMYSRNCKTIDESTLAVLRDKMEHNVGYSGVSLMGISQIGSSPVTLEKDYKDIIPMLDVQTGDVLLECDLREDSMIACTLDDYLKFSNDIASTSDKFDLEFLSEDFQAVLTKASNIQGTTVCFISVLKLTSCINGLIVTDSWDGNALSIKSVSELKFNKLDMF